MIKVDARPLRVIHWEYHPRTNFESVATAFEFGHVVGKGQGSTYSNAIRFRLVTRWNEGSVQVLSYIGEQAFIFPLKLSSLEMANLQELVSETYRQYLLEYQKKSPRPPINLRIQYPTVDVLEQILKDLKKNR